MKSSRDLIKVKLGSNSNKNQIKSKFHKKWKVAPKHNSK